MLYPLLSDQIIDGVFEVHRELGAGLLEAPYHNALYYCLKGKGLMVGYQVPFNVVFRGETVGEYFADITVEDKFIIEVKSVAALSPVMSAQVINYLKISGLAVGYLVNFQGVRPVFKRFVNTPP